MKHNQVVLQHQLQQKDKLIEFLRTQFQAETGKLPTIPVSLQTILGVSEPDIERDIYSIEKEEDKDTFLEAVHKLKLPQPLQMGGKKGQEIKDPKKLPKAIIKKFEFLETINLSGFRHRGFSRAALRELVSGI